MDTDDKILLADDNRAGLVLYAAKCAYLSGKDEGEKFRYLREISDLWAKKGWNTHDKRVILEAVNYLMTFNNTEYKYKFVEYVENLQMTKGDREMYKSVFEEVYGERGRQKGRLEGIKEGLRDGIQKGLRDGIQKGLRDGIQKGIQKGRQESALEIARNLLVRGVAPDVIAESSGLSLDEVKTLSHN
jgi:predicted transposase/invertase (TIGR01784 family)